MPAGKDYPEFCSEMLLWGAKTSKGSLVFVLLGAGEGFGFKFRHWS